MKKRLIVLASVITIAAFLAVSIFSVSAAVFVQDGNYKYQIYDDSTAAIAGYTSDTADDVIVPRAYDIHTIIGVANFAFQNNSSVRTIDFMEAPDLEKIGMYAFNKCSSLESVTVPSSITYVDVSAFRECTSLTDATFYGNNNAVPVECFYNCSSLKTVRLSARLKSIQSLAFAGCTSLEYVELYDTVTYIAPNAFDGDENLTLGVFYGTYAYRYAIDNNFDYYLLDGVLLGDADGSGYISINDVTTIQQHIADMIALDGIYLHAADIDGNGEIDINDATELQRFIAEFEVDYPIGEAMTQ